MNIVEIVGDERVVRDWDWLRETFGPGVRIDARQDPGSDGWSVIELTAVEGAGCQTDVYCVGEEYQDVQGVAVARYWPSVQAPLPMPLSTWRSTGVWGRTDDGGRVGFGMGSGDKYRPGEGDQGASEVWVEGNSERVAGLGWLLGTGHRHLNVTFFWAHGSAEPPPDPGEVADLVCQVRAAVRMADADLAEARHHLDALQELLGIGCADEPIEEPPAIKAGG